MGFRVLIRFLLALMGLHINRVCAGLWQTDSSEYDILCQSKKTLVEVDPMLCTCMAGLPIEWVLTFLPQSPRPHLEPNLGPLKTKPKRSFCLESETTGNGFN